MRGQRRPYDPKGPEASAQLIDPESFRYRPGTPLPGYPTLWKVVKDASDQLKVSIERLSELQELLYAHNRRSVLLIFQGMDAAGKDSTIKYVTSGVNPAGFQVYNFSQPTRKELDHNYLWAYWNAMPERVRIGIFNRSYYEEVLVVRVWFAGDRIAPAVSFESQRLSLLDGEQHRRGHQCAGQYFVVGQPGGPVCLQWILSDFQRQ